MQRLTRILGLAQIYQLYQWMVGAHKYSRLFAERYIQYQVGQKILDIGCGPADILKYLPKDVDYTGIDLSEDYIINACKAHPHQRFICANVAEALPLDRELFDTVFFIGVQHHLTDVEMEATLRFAWSKVKSGGRLLSLEPVRLPGQGRLERWFMDNDRGKHIRTAEHYRQISEKVQKGGSQTILKNTMNIPFTIIISESIKA